MSTRHQEARLNALERRQSNLETHVEEISSDLEGKIEQSSSNLEHKIDHLYNDMVASFKQAVAYDIRFEQQLDERFNKIETTMATRDDLATIKDDLVAIKDDMKAMENRILDTFKQLLSVLNLPRPLAE